MSLEFFLASPGGIFAGNFCREFLPGIFAGDFCRGFLPGIFG
jgi:hypothetical protein